ncbi:MAG: hypothetical protein NQU42_07790 [Methanothrix sp.]|uniref:hypothetical protein n=1 Tax=Methanothrix sp. TaxID=90426 RepID=UPI0025E45FAC|nr:hypothetical protein [Methanothrix sp.]MCQ8903976.1 hypothetical protein [Methanothrix sp.]
MKRVGFVLLLLLGVGLSTGLAVAELTASQWLDRESIKVGDTAVVTLNLIYVGDNATQASVVPVIPYGLTTPGPGMYMVTLYPGQPETVSYPVIAGQPGYYDVISSISYTEYGFVRELQMVSPLVVINQSPESPPGAPPSGPEDMPPLEPGPGMPNVVPPKQPI